MNKNICEIYNSRPDMCKNFPVHAKQIREFNKCSYYFEDGKRKGECNGCGQCCVCMPWNEAGTELVSRCKNKDAVCRYLKQ